MAFPPVLNGLDYVEDAITLLSGTPDQRALKYAVLHLQAGVEVLLKVALIRHDWRQVFSNVNSANAADYQAGTFHSAGAKVVIQRLRDAGIQVPADLETAYHRLASIRNSLQHLGTGNSFLGVEVQTGQVLAGLIDFLPVLDTQGHEPDEDAALADTTALIRRELGRVRELVTARMTSIEPALVDALGGGLFVLACPDCAQMAMPFDPDADQQTCLCCLSQWPDAGVLASSYAAAILGYTWKDVADGGDEPVEDCMDCDERALVRDVLLRGHQDRQWMCFACGATAQQGELTRCLRCNGAWVRVTEDGGTICYTCSSLGD